MHKVDEIITRATTVRHDGVRKHLNKNICLKKNQAKRNMLIYHPEMVDRGMKKRMLDYLCTANIELGQKSGGGGGTCCHNQWDGVDQRYDTNVNSLVSQLTTS